MLKFLLICTLFRVSVQSKLEEIEGFEDKFEKFIKEFNRQYKDDNEKALRFSYFVDNVKEADELNKKYKDAEFGINQFSDWSKEELKRLCNAKPIEIDYIDNLIPLDKYNEGPAPDTFDWRQHNVVTPVKYQGSCGSCWLFSAIGNIEGQYALKHKTLVSLSVQELVDCVYQDPQDGCDGGWPSVALEYLTKSNNPVESDSNYPYVDEGQTCHINPKKGVAQVIGHHFINATSEDDVKQALYEIGPLSYCMNGDSLQFLKNGILEGCPSEEVTHCMLIVGYGINDSGEKYWIVKNSWGHGWNGDGYFKLKRGVDACNILETGHIQTGQVA